MKIETIYKHFLIVPVTHLPVVTEEETFVGLLSKEKVIMDMADLSLQDQEFDKIPEHLLDFNISESIIYYFQKNRTIPVLNVLAQKIGSWEKPRFLAEVSTLTTDEIEETPVETTEEEPEDELESEDNSNVRQTIIRYIEMILENFPDPLYATDKEGKTTFFNENFEKKVLTIPFFKDSISFAEKYFRDLNRDLISLYVKKKNSDSDTTNIPTLQAFVKNIDKFIRIITLKDRNRIQGFLYHIIEPALNEKKKQELQFPSLEQAYLNQTPLSDILREVEMHYIYQSLKENENNISHTAAILGIPRSTLQNRIKQLNIHEHFKNLQKSKIPRSKKLKEKSSFSEKNIDINPDEIDNQLKLNNQPIIELSLNDIQPESPQSSSVVPNSKSEQ